MNPPEPKPCDYCGRVGTHTTICWAIARAANTGCQIAPGSTDRTPDPQALDRAEDRYLNALIGEPQW